MFLSIYMHSQFCLCFPILSQMWASENLISLDSWSPAVQETIKITNNFVEKLIRERKTREKWKQRCFRLPCGYHGIVRVHQEQQFSENSIFNFDNVFHRMKQDLQFRQGHHLAYFYLPMQLRHQEPPTTWDSWDTVDENS